MLSYPATMALAKIVSTTATPARSSTRPYPKVKRALGFLRANRKAMPSGIAVVASAKLWIVSASSATLPEKNTTISCRTAVTIRAMNDHFTAHSPRSFAAIAGSTTPWLWT
jgi:hypothetical protein